MYIFCFIIKKVMNDACIFHIKGTTSFLEKDVFSSFHERGTKKKFWPKKLFLFSGLPRKFRQGQHCKAFTQYWRQGQIRSVLSCNVFRLPLYEGWNICAKLTKKTFINLPAHIDTKQPLWHKVKIVRPCYSDRR